MELHVILVLTLAPYVFAISTDDLINAVQWKELVVLCDQGFGYCPVEELLSSAISSYHVLDLQNTSLLVTRFEEIYKLSQMNWLVFCCDCVPLLSVINEFESPHQLQGYFTHMYQWILVTNLTQTRAHLGEHTDRITNLAVLNMNTVGDLYTAMYGDKRYFDLVKLQGNYSQANVFPNLVTGFNRAKLIDKKADLAAALTVTPERRSIVDHPSTAVDVDEFVIIYHKPDPIFMSLHIFTMPFQQSVWICFAGTLAGTSFVFLLSHWLHSKWTGSHCQIFRYGTYIFQSTISQGSTVQPIHQSMRIVYGVYSLGCMILMTVYTGQLVALLAVKHSPVPFNSIRQLAQNTEYNLGALGGSFSASRILDPDVSPSSPMAQLQVKLLHDADKDPSVLSPVYDDHIQRLLTEKYALYGTRAMYDALAEQYCSVSAMKIRFSGALLSNFMLQKNSVYTSTLNNMLNRIQEGKLDSKIRKEFWPKPKHCDEGDDQVVYLGNIFGIFYVLFAGISLAFGTLLVENIVWFIVFQAVYRNINSL